MIDRSKAALLIVAHGSTVNPDSSMPTLAHAAEIRRRKIFAEVRCAFWKEEPSLRDALFLFDPQSVPEVYVVPNFISEGYFTQTVVPRELELDGRMTKRSNGQIWHYCPPVGNHSMVTELLLKRAHEIAPDATLAKTSLLIVAHGTDLNENSAVPNVVVVPFFISDGLHSYEDIPRLIGIVLAGGADRGERGSEPRVTAYGEIFRRNPYTIDGRSLFYAPSIGTDPGFADIIIEQAASAKS